MSHTMITINRTKTPSIHVRSEGRSAPTDSHREILPLTDSHFKSDSNNNVPHGVITVVKNSQSRIKVNSHHLTI